MASLRSAADAAGDAASRAAGRTVRRVLWPGALVAAAGVPQLLPIAHAEFLPGVTNPGLQQQQERQQQQLEQTQPGVQREAAPPLINAPTGGSTPDPGDDPELLIQRVEVQGARMISAERIKAVFAPLLSTAANPRPVRFSQLQAALDTASNLYRDKGFFTSRVLLPKGGYANGVLTLVAVEGFIEEVEVIGRGSEGLKRWAQYYMQPLVSTAQQPRPIRFRQLERQLLLMQGFGGVQFRSTLVKSSSFSGSKLVLEMTPQYFSGSVGLDNNVQPLLGDYEATLQLQANVLKAPQPLQLNAYGTYAFPYPNGLSSGSLAMNTPLGNHGLRLVGLGSLTSTNSIGTPVAVGGPVINLTSSGESWLGSMALRYPLLLSRNGSLGVSLAGEVQNTTNNNYLDGMLAISNPTRLRVLRLGFDGTLSTPYYASSANLQISQGLPISNAFDAATLAQTGGSLPSGSVSYTSSRLTLRHQQRLGGSNTFVTLTGSGQLTNDVLPSPEDFAYGGPFLGRAYMLCLTRFVSRAAQRAAAEVNASSGPSAS
ncbi:MAG: Heme/hemopexin transporter protein HuxB [Cyanobacteriota bacterium]|jgi:hemolysin activation/secretion protein